MKIMKIIGFYTAPLAMALCFFAAKSATALSAKEDCHYPLPLVSKGHAEDAKELFCAVINNSLERVRSALSRGADPHAKNDRGQTPLHVFALYSQRGEYKPGILSALASAGADVNATEALRGETPLHQAAYVAEGSQYIIDLALSGADVHATAWADNTTSPLDLAQAWNPNPEVTRTLIRLSADAYGEDPLQDPLLLSLKYNENPEVFRALMCARYLDTSPLRDWRKIDENYTAYLINNSSKPLLLKVKDALFSRPQEIVSFESRLIERGLIFGQNIAPYQSAAEENNNPEVLQSFYDFKGQNCLTI